jgi:hypothetical protein
MSQKQNQNPNLLPSGDSHMPGAIIYRGPSLLDSTPIVAIAVWNSTNSKTGDMLQTYILVDSDEDPIQANRSGADHAICGDCPHRGDKGVNRSCYVTLMHGPLVVFRAFKRGVYPDATSSQARAALGINRMVRIGTYGDGAAVPKKVWDDLLKSALGHTAYTHQAKYKGTTNNKTDNSARERSLRARYMASVETLEDARAAWGNKYRTFRIVRSVSDIERKHEVLCPASAEAGKRVQCADCRLCNGGDSRAKSVAIVAHGTGAKHF